MPARRRPLALLAAAATAALFGGGTAQLATASPAQPRAAHHTVRHTVQRPYLALGDSVPFGYISGDGNAYKLPVNFVGYPMYVGHWGRLHTVDAACPGEATGGFISATNPDDNGCRTYRSDYPLHVRYSGTQLQFAERFLRAHKNTAMVSLMLGANDGFRLEKQCNYDTGCILAGLSGLLQTIGANDATIVKGLRSTGYRGPIEMVLYYSTDYTNSTQTLFTKTLNGELTKVAKRFHLLIADSFAGMKAAAASAGGNTCEAGLLNVSPSDPTTCDVHPSQAGARVLAETVLKAYRTWHASHPRA